MRTSSGAGSLLRAAAGASGFISIHVVKAHLERGFAVRGTVRSHEKGAYLASLFSKDFPGKFEYVIVKDIGIVRHSKAHQLTLTRRRTARSTQRLWASTQLRTSRRPSTSLQRATSLLVCNAGVSCVSSLTVWQPSSSPR